MGGDPELEEAVMPAPLQQQACQLAGRGDVRLGQGGHEASFVVARRDRP